MWFWAAKNQLCKVVFGCLCFLYSCCGMVALALLLWVCVVCGGLFFSVEVVVAELLALHQRKFGAFCCFCGLGWFVAAELEVQEVANWAAKDYF
jgi:hypothetical protein